MVAQDGVLGMADGWNWQIGPWPMRVGWIAEPSGHTANRQFRDAQMHGPFRRWEHTHRFKPDGAEACWLEDRAAYELPFGRLGTWLGGRVI